jgi:CBS domain-containing protein
MQARAADVLSFKGHDVYSIVPESSVRAAVGLMARHNVGALVVLNWRRRVIGLFSERDVLWRVVHENRSPETLVVEVMTRDPVMIAPETPIGDAMRIMTERRTRHLPVVDGEHEVRGLLSIGDVTKWITRDLQQHVGDLASYICGGSQVEVASLL